MTPKTAAVLWSIARILADQGYDDIEEHGSDFLRENGEWYLFGHYPRLTWGQGVLLSERYVIPGYSGHAARLSSSMVAGS